MEQIRLLDGLVEKTAPGRTPDYTKAHLLYALILLEKQRMGRKQLAEELRLGEGTIRTLLSRLQDEKLIEITRPGARLSSMGEAYLKKINSVMSWTPIPSTEATVDSVNWGVLVRGVSKRVRYGVEQRDQALIHGATGASTLVFVEGGWNFPGLGEEFTDVIIDLMDKLVPVDGDVAVIGTSGDSFTATIGALAAAIDLLG
jgi:predicted transcriptional regulator